VNVTPKPLGEDPDNHDEHTLQSNRADLTQWRCLTCGQHIFVDVDLAPPDICEYCKDMTTWEHIDKSS